MASSKESKDKLVVGQELAARFLGEKFYERILSTMVSQI